MTQKQENERLARVEEKTDGLVKDVSEIKGELHDFIKSADSKYAPKWVANALTLVITTVMLAVIGALVALVVINPDTTVQPTTKIQVTTPEVRQ